MKIIDPRPVTPEALASWVHRLQRKRRELAALESSATQAYSFDKRRRIVETKKAIVMLTDVTCGLRIARGDIQRGEVARFSRVRR